jgi:hypothetical protein
MMNDGRVLQRISRALLVGVVVLGAGLFVVRLGAAVALLLLR